MIIDRSTLIAKAGSVQIPPTDKAPWSYTLADAIPSNTRTIEVKFTGDNLEVFDSERSYFSLLLSRKGEAGKRLYQQINERLGYPDLKP